MIEGRCKKGAIGEESQGGRKRGDAWKQPEQSRKLILRLVHREAISGNASSSLKPM